MLAERLIVLYRIFLGSKLENGRKLSIISCREMPKNGFHVLLVMGRVLLF